MTGRVSVLMGVYNCQETIVQAIESIKSQTYRNWELIICDDGSTDHTFEIVCKYAREDERIIVMKNCHNYGLNRTLNNCYGRATGDYIARMDGDDESLPRRFEKQVRFLSTHPEYAIVSSAMIFFDESGEWGRTRTIEYPDSFDVVTKSPICHAPVMMRKECMDAVNGYTEDKRMLRVEDVNLWIKLYAAGYKCHNLQEPLYKMRNDKEAFSRRKYKYRVNSTYVRLQGCKTLHLGLKAYLLSFLPMVKGVVPGRIRKEIRRKMS